jgi:hypothetical protein
MAHSKKHKRGTKHRSLRARTSRSSRQPRSRQSRPSSPIIFQTKYRDLDSQYLANLLNDDNVPALSRRPFESDDDASDLEIDVSGMSSCQYGTDSDSGDSDDDDTDDEEDKEEMPSLSDKMKTSEEAMSNVRDMEDLLFLQRHTAEMRNERWDHERLDWNQHVAQLQHEGSFVNEYTMSASAHGKLVRILDPILQRVEYNSRSSQPILVEHIVATGLRVLAGGRVKDQRHIIGSCLTAGYVATDDFIDAVNSAPELDIRLPQTVEEWRHINAGFTRKSSDRLIDGCVGVFDGFFQRSNKPSKKEVANVVAYYSGHYESYGVNCQACVQSDLQFNYFGVVSPGSTNDNISYPQAEGLKEVFDALPLGLYGLADAAYTLGENMLTPFTGVDRLDPAQDAFNYYLSQLRIRVEMAFGRLVNKFRILHGKIEGSQDRVTAVLTACSRLHNFIIKHDGPFEACNGSVEDEMNSLEIHPNPSAPLGMSYLPVVPDETFEAYTGVSHTREAIVDFLRAHEIGRPLHNIERKKREMSVVVSPSGFECHRDFFSPI